MGHGLYANHSQRRELFRCLVAYCGIMDLRPYREYSPPTVSDDELAAFSPAVLASEELPEGVALPPLFLARAGRDAVPFLNESIDCFVSAALPANAPLTLVSHPTGRHGFDVLDDDSTSHAIMRATIAFLKAHLQEPAAVTPSDGAADPAPRRRGRGR